jgi:hypothetical protein
VFWAGPHSAGHRDLERIVRWPDVCSGCGSGAWTNTNFGVGLLVGVGSTGVGGSSNTLLGFETTGPLFPGHRVWWEACCCPRFWWWGVVFDSWIVVASINSQQSRGRRALPFSEGGVVRVWVLVWVVVV